MDGIDEAQMVYSARAEDSENVKTWNSHKGENIRTVLREEIENGWLV